MPFGLVFLTALARLTGRPMPATEAMIATASLAGGRDFARENDLLEPLGLGDEATATRAGLLARL